MPQLKAILLSSPAKKFYSALTGLFLTGFIVVHLAGNLMLFSPDSDPFNAYAHKLISLGVLLYLAEFVLVAAFLIHAWFGTQETLNNRRARGRQPYAQVADAGDPSRKTLSSRTMIWTGVVIFLFTIIHVKTFKYGPGLAEGYVTTIHGIEMRDLYRLVYEVFSKPLYVIGYVAAMALLGFHLRHGFWSAFQSLGVHHPRYTPLIYGFGVLLAIVLSVGFLVIPVYVFIKGMIS